MKSIIQEASSIAKAIEKAWLNAEQPKEFSVKVFELPEKNFIGMTIKSAKIGIFFKEESIAKAGERPRREVIKRKPPVEKKPQPHQQKIQHQQPQKPQHQQQAVQTVQKNQNVATQDSEKSQKRIMWTNDMVAEARIWVDGALKAMEKQNISFTTDTNGYYLRFTFAQPLVESDEKERNLFRSFSFLMLQALKRKFKRPLRGFKIVLTRSA